MSTPTASNPPPTVKTTPDGWRLSRDGITPLEPKFEAPWTEKVTVSHWDKHSKQFVKPLHDVHAYRSTYPDGTKVIVVREIMSNGLLPVGSEIIASDGTWIVTEAPSERYHVKPKP